jgi:enoyl-CoA hydratase/carnithine racemase
MRFDHVVEGDEMSEEVEEAMGGVLYKRDGSVCTVTLNKPERLNALDHGPGSLHRDVIEAVVRANADDNVRCIVVTGAGRAFSAGGHFGGNIPDNPMDWYRFVRAQDEDSERLRDLDKPVIGAINGVCYGAAMMMVCNFDFLIAVDTAELGLIETRFGEPAAEALAFLVGPQWAKFMAITGEMISARKAKEIGLVLDVFDKDDFATKVYDLARRISAVPPNAVMIHRRIVNTTMDNMGWKNQKAIGRALNGILGAAAKENRSVTGRSFSDILEEDGWSAFKEARDSPFFPPWLDRIR